MRLVDGDEIYAKINKLRDTDKLNDYELILLDTVLAAIKFSDTVDPVKHGHWVIYPTLFSFLRCSQCHNGIHWHNDKKPNYCLYCGAKMDGDSDDFCRV